MNKVFALLAATLMFAFNAQAETRSELNNYLNIQNFFAAPQQGRGQDQKVRNLTAEFEINTSPKRDAVNVVVEIEKNQINSILGQGGYVEIRFYVGKKGQEERIRDDKEYTLRKQKDRFTLPFEDVCSKPGSVWVKVWAVVRDTKREYTTEATRKEFICAAPSLQSKFNFSVTNGLVNAKVSVNDGIYKAVKAQKGFVEVRLYAGNQRGREQRINANKTYKMDSNPDSFTFPPSDVCESFTLKPYERYLKVWTSARDAKGNPMTGIAAQNITFKVTCAGLLSNLFDLIDEALED